MSSFSDAMAPLGAVSPGAAPQVVGWSGSIGGKPIFIDFEVLETHARQVSRLSADISHSMRTLQSVERRLAGYSNLPFRGDIVAAFARTSVALPVAADIFDREVANIGEYRSNLQILERTHLGYLTQFSAFMAAALVNAAGNEVVDGAQVVSTQYITFEVELGAVAKGTASVTAKVVERADGKQEITIVGVVGLGAGAGVGADVSIGKSEAGARAEVEAMIKAGGGTTYLVDNDKEQAALLTYYAAPVGTPLGDAMRAAAEHWLPPRIRESTSMELSEGVTYKAGNGVEIQEGGLTLDGKVVSTTELKSGEKTDAITLSYTASESVANQVFGRPAKGEVSGTQAYGQSVVVDERGDLLQISYTEDRTAAGSVSADSKPQPAGSRGEQPAGRRPSGSAGASGSVTESTEVTLDFRNNPALLEIYMVEMSKAGDILPARLSALNELMKKYGTRQVTTSVASEVHATAHLKLGAMVGGGVTGGSDSPVGEPEVAHPWDNRRSG